MFPSINAEQLKAELNLESEAVKQGGSDLPSSSDQGPDPPQEAVVTKLREIHNAEFEKASKALSEYMLRRRELLRGLNHSEVVSEIQTRPISAGQRIHEFFNQRRDRLMSLRRDEQRAIRQFRVFQEQNDLSSRQAHYPESQILHWRL